MPLSRVTSALLAAGFATVVTWGLMTWWVRRYPRREVVEDSSPEEGARAASEKSGGGGRSVREASSGDSSPAATGNRDEPTSTRASEVPSDGMRNVPSGSPPSAAEEESELSLLRSVGGEIVQEERASSGVRNPLRRDTSNETGAASVASDLGRSLHLS